MSSAADGIADPEQLSWTLHVRSGKQRHLVTGLCKADLHQSQTLLPSEEKLSDVHIKERCAVHSWLAYHYIPS